MRTGIAEQRAKLLETREMLRVLLKKAQGGDAPFPPNLEVRIENLERRIADFVTYLAAKYSEQ